MCLKPTHFFATILILVVMTAGLTGCRAGVGQMASGGQGTSQAGATRTGETAIQTGGAGVTAPPATDTPIPTPTVTPEPLAVQVNGEGISVAEYQAELGQLQEALKTLGKDLPADQQRQQVLDNLIDTLLLAQGATDAGFQVDDTAVQAEADRLAQQMGGAEAGAQALKDWISQRGYSQVSFNAALRRQLAAAHQRDALAAAVPNEAEQVHVRQILTIDESIADRAYNQVKVPGMNFAAYAYQYDPETGGDLGWFPRGYLTQPEVEDAAFKLQPGEISPVIKSAIGYHILQLIAREPARVISPDARRVLQHKAIVSWLKARRDASKVEILLPGS